MACRVAAGSRAPESVSPYRVTPRRLGHGWIGYLPAWPHTRTPVPCPSRPPTTPRRSCGASAGCSASWKLRPLSRIRAHGRPRACGRTAGPPDHLTPPAMASTESVGAIVVSGAGMARQKVICVTSTNQMWLDNGPRGVRGGTGVRRDSLGSSSQPLRGGLRRRSPRRPAYSSGPLTRPARPGSVRRPRARSAPTCPTAPASHPAATATHLRRPSARSASPSA